MEWTWRSGVLIAFNTIDKAVYLKLNRRFWRRRCHIADISPPEPYDLCQSRINYIVYIYGSLKPRKLSHCDTKSHVAEKLISGRENRNVIETVIKRCSCILIACPLPGCIYAPNGLACGE